MALQPPSRTASKDSRPKERNIYRIYTVSGLERLQGAFGGGGASVGLAAFGGARVAFGPLVGFRVWDCCGALKFNKVSDVWISGLRVSNACSGNEGIYIYI